jgi:AAA+ ATPase superfamily predicted ATPase
MINPFKYGGVVGKDAFCNRRTELREISRTIENGLTTFLYSERRMGKTSLVKLALTKMPKQYLCTYVDLWPTDGAAGFTSVMAKAIAESIATSADRILQAARTLFSRLAPTVTTDNEGRPSVSFTLAGTGRLGPEIDEVLAAPAAIAKRRRRRVVIVLDEFQRILEYGDDFVERKIRSAIQDQPGVSYLFLGSRKHLIQKMLTDRARPLYGSGSHYMLGPIAKKHWAPFIKEHFAKSRRIISNDNISKICEMTEGHPFYTQHLCHSLWEICEPNSAVSDGLIQQALDLLLDRESYAYTSLWESLSTNQRRFLKGLAQEPQPVKAFSAEFLRKYQISSPSNAQRVIDALLAKDVIDRQNSSYVIVDRFFKLWIINIQQ